MKNRVLRRALLLLLAGVLCLAAVGCGDAGRAVVGECHGDSILQEEYDFLTAGLDAGLSQAELRQAIEPAIIEDRAILAAARALPEPLSPESESVQAAVESGYDEAVTSSGGKKAFRAMLKERGLTEHHFRRMLAIAELERLLQAALFAGTELETESAFAAWLKDSAHHARAERFGFASAVEAERFLSAVSGGADADAAVTDCGGTKRRASDFFLGLGGDAVDTAVFSLPEDGATLSGVVRTGDGYAVYRRLPVTAAERADVAALQGLALRDKLRSLRWESFLSPYRTNLRVNWA